MLDRFEKIVRRSHLFDESEPEDETHLHPFDVHAIHDDLPQKVRRLFDNSHFAEATFEACKFLDRRVQKLANSRKSGFKLMMEAFNKEKPLIALNGLATESEQDEQEGYRFIFSGGVLAIRNPRGHECEIEDDIDTCLDHLRFISMLLRRLEAAPR